jgi:thiol-disulfide isomerase/thioredoxin
MRAVVLALALGACRGPEPIADPAARATVLLFLAHDCPVANAYAPEVGRLCHEYGPRDVSFRVVYAEPDLAPETARRHAAEFGFPCPTLLDSDLRLVRRLGVTKTPEAVLLDPEGKALYQGRIDDLYAALGTRRPQPTRRDLREALEAALAGRPVPVARTDVVGCFVKELPP